MKAAILVVAALMSTAAAAHDDVSARAVQTGDVQTGDVQTGNTSAASRTWAQALFKFDWEPGINFHDSPTASLTAFDFNPGFNVNAWRDYFRVDWEPGFTPGTDFSFNWSPRISAER